MTKEKDDLISREEVQRRLDEIQESIECLARRELDRDPQLHRGDEFDAVQVGLHMLGEELQATTFTKEFALSLLDSMLDMLIVVHPNGTIRRVNEETCRVLGTEAGELIGSDLRLFLDDEHRELLFRELFSGSELRNFDLSFVTKNGERIAALVNVSSVPDRRGGWEAFVIVARDLREKKRLLLAAERASTATSIIDGMPSAAAITDMNGEILQLNSVFEHTFGWDREVVLGQTFAGIGLVSADQEERIQEMGRRAHAGLTALSAEDAAPRRASWHAGEPVQHAELSIRCKDGNQLPMLTSWAPFLSSEGPEGIICTLVDITERKAVEEQLSNRLKYEACLGNCSRVLLTDRSDAIDDALRFLLETSGVSRIYTFENFEDPSDGLCMCQTHESCDRGVASEIDNPILKHVPYQTGAPRWRDELSQGRFIGGLVKNFPDVEREYLEPQGILSLLAIPITIDGAWHGFIGLDDTRNAREWTDEDIRVLETAAHLIGTHLARRFSHQRLEEERSQMLSIFNSIDEIIYVADPQTYEVVFANKALIKLLGEDPRGRICYEAFQGLSQPCSFCTNEIILNERDRPYLWEFHNPALDTDYLITDRIIKWTDGRELRFELALDITAQRKIAHENADLEEQLRQAQKMEAIGNLAGGVAHDINNMLAAIMGLASVLRVEIDTASPLQHDLAGILKSCQRGRDLTRNLLGFARQGKYRTESLLLNSVVDEVIDLLDRTIPKRIGIEKALSPNLDTIEGDPVQIHQVVVNLSLNAVDAMHGKGTLIYVTNVVEVTEETSSMHGRLPPGRYVCLEVTDTGVGMDGETLRHAFEPFYTTKPKGEGTGLGLSMVYGTIKNHGGEARIFSEEGRGTTAKIYLPSLSTEVGPTRKTREERSIMAGKGTVLLVDDEALVRMTGRRLLSLLGYDVLEAENGEAAVEIYREQKDRIDLVILDMVMPVMDGEETFDQLRRIDPKARILLSSGYSREEPAERLLEQGAVGFVQKPYHLGHLSDALACLPSVADDPELR